MSAEKKEHLGTSITFTGRGEFMNHTDVGRGRTQNSLTGKPDCSAKHFWLAISRISTTGH